MKRKKIQFKEASLLDVRGTSSYRGYIKATAEELSKFFGNPILGDDKTTFEWYCKYGSVVFTIYDYRECIRPKKDSLIEYHIGTNTNEDTGIIVGLLAGLGLNAYIEK